MELIRSKVIETALSQIGYQGESKSSKYSKDLDAVKFYNYPKDGACTWCSIFVDWCIYQNTNPQTADNARAALYEPNVDNCGAGCVQSAQYYKSHGAWYSKPSDAHKGDKVFFKNSAGNIYHAGIVVDWDNSGIYTVEGSTGGAKVLKRFYSYSDSKLAGFGRPQYTANEPDVDPEPTPEPTPTTTKYIVKTNGGTLSLRAEPNVSSTVLANIPNGTTLDVIEIVKGESINYNTDWAKTTYNGKTGYCSCNYLVPATGKKKYTVRVNSFLTIRSGPGVNYKMLGQLYNGNVVIIDKIEGEWGRISEGRWVCMNYLV